MATPANTESIQKLRKKITQLERWAVQYKKDKSRYNGFVTRIGRLKGSIDILERTTKDGKLNFNNFSKDIKEHFDKIKQSFNELTSSLPLNWEQLKEKCMEVTIDASKYQQILKSITDIKTEQLAFKHAKLLFSNSNHYLYYSKNQREMLVDKEKEIDDVMTQIKAIETYVVPQLIPIKSKKEKAKGTSTKTKGKPSTALKISDNEYIWTPKITGTIEWGKVSKKINIDDLTNIPTYNIPWNTKGKIILNLSLSFSLNSMPQKEYKQEKVVYGEFSVDNKGKFKLHGLNQQSSSETGLSIKSTIIDLVTLKIEKAQEVFKKKDDSWIPDLGKLYDKVVDNIPSISPPIELIKTQINKHSFDADIYAVATDSSIRIETKYQISPVSIDLSVAPFNLGAGTQFTLPGSNKTNNIGTINFEVKSPKMGTATKGATIVFEKEGEFKLDKTDENNLHKWWRAVESGLKKELRSYEESKNTPEDQIKDIVDAKFGKILSRGEYSIQLKGFASSTESKNKNNKVADKRVKSIQDYLIKKVGIKANTIGVLNNGQKDCEDKNGKNSKNNECRIGTIKFTLNQTP